MSKVESHSSGLIAAISSTVVALRRQSRLLYHKLSDQGPWRFHPIHRGDPLVAPTWPRLPVLGHPHAASIAWWTIEGANGEIEKEFARPEGACTVRLLIVQECRVE